MLRNKKNENKKLDLDSGSDTFGQYKWVDLSTVLESKKRKRSVNIFE